MIVCNWPELREALGYDAWADEQPAAWKLKVGMRPNSRGSIEKKKARESALH